MEYGKRLKEIREAKKISIYRLSQNSSISQGHISDLENDKNHPTIETLKRLFMPMRITLSEFFSEDGEIAVLNDFEKELFENYRTLSDDKAELYLQLG